VLADQQHHVYAERREIMESHPGARRKLIQDMLCEVIGAEVAAATRQGAVTESFWRGISTIYPATVTAQALATQRGCAAGELPPDYVTDQVIADARRVLARREAELGKAEMAEEVKRGRLHTSRFPDRTFTQTEADLGSAVMRNLEKRLTLSAIDRSWRDHVVAMDSLLHAISARSPGGPPLAEYRREAGALFSAMRDKVRKDIIGALFQARVERAPSGYAAR
jgi:preprotein translocase subunit SecA